MRVGELDGEKEKSMTKILFDLRSAVIKNYLIFSSTFLSCSVFLFLSFFFVGRGVISIVLGYKGEPPKKNFNKEGGHHVLQ